MTSNLKEVSGVRTSQSEEKSAPADHLVLGDELLCLEELRGLEESEVESAPRQLMEFRC
jgi:hypothetical protein